jgi:hypothetical protein
MMATPAPMSGYEKRALLEIHVWKNPEVGGFGRLMERLTWPFEKAGDLAMQVPGVE